jgi:hypothetical protein
MHRINRRSLWSAVARDTAGKLREVILRPGGAAEISRWWSAAQPPGQIKGDISRPGRDAGLALIGKSSLVLRPFRARLAACAIPVASPPANISSAPDAEEFASGIPRNRFGSHPGFPPFPGTTDPAPCFRICAATTEETTKAVPGDRTPKLPLTRRDFPYMQSQPALNQDIQDWDIQPGPPGPQRKIKTGLAPRSCGGPCGLCSWTI